MYNYFCKFISSYDYPKNCIDYLQKCAFTVLNGFKDDFDLLLSDFEKGGFCLSKIYKSINELSVKTDIHVYTINFMVLVCKSQAVLPKYREIGIDDKLIHDNFEDILYKFRECINVYGVAGLHITDWFNHLYNVNIFKLGRLEYEIAQYNSNEPLNYGGITLNKGDKYVNVHIPSCGPLTKDLRQESYSLAYDFFKDLRKDGKLLLLCNSWLLYPDSINVFPKNSNLAGFLADWEILRKKEDPSFDDCWRVFGVPKYSGNLKILRTDTTLRKNIVNWLENGKTMGTGLGAQIITK